MKGLKALVLSFVALCAVPLFATKFDGYIKIDGVQGEAKDPAHQGWIELVNWNWVPGSNCTHTHEVNFIAVSTKAVSGGNKLMQICNAHMPLPHLAVDLPGGQHHVLDNVSFRSCHHNDGMDGGAPFDTVSFGFDRCTTHGPQVIVGASPPQRLNLVFLQFQGAAGFIKLQNNPRGASAFFNQAFRSKQTTPSVVIKANSMTWTFNNLLVSGYQQEADGSEKFTLNFASASGPPGGYTQP
jgi:hypothetical protein